MTKYFQLSHELHIDGAWYLNKIRTENAVELITPFWTAQRFDVYENLTIEPNVFGAPVDFRLTTFGAPVVSRSLAEVVEKHDRQAIQRIPVVVLPSTTGYEILNVITVCECIDYEHTFVKYHTEDYSPAEKLGKIHWLANIRIRPELVAGHHIFRLAEWNIVLIVSEHLKQALEDRKFSGVKFTPAF